MLVLWSAALIITLSSFTTVSGDDAVPRPERLLTLGLVADSHYDTFPAGERAPWQPVADWYNEQAKRTTTTTKRRYDVAKDKMEESIDVFNRLFSTDGGSGGPGVPTRPRMDAVINLGDLVNNDLMWNLRPILDVFNQARAPHFNLLGNHDLRAHNDRFGKHNKTQLAWLRAKLTGGTEWYYAVTYAPFVLVFVDSMVMEAESLDPAKRTVHLAWLQATLEDARQHAHVVILFAHIPIGVETNAMGPTLKRFDDIIIAAFFGHNHKGGYIQQGNMHCVTINGQIETLINAFAIVEVYRDRIEVTGFGRVPSRVLRISGPDARRRLRDYSGPVFHDITSSTAQPLPPPDLWRERLQEPPPLLLRIPNYRKPLIPFVEPNTGNTLFISEVYRHWPRRVRAATAREDPVDLNSAVTGGRVLLVDNMRQSGPIPLPSASIAAHAPEGPPKHTYPPTTHTLPLSSTAISDTIDIFLLLPVLFAISLAVFLVVFSLKRRRR